MAKLSKRVRAFKEKVDPQKAYPLEVAVNLLKEFATVKFNETVEVAVNLGIDARKSDQAVRGATTLPFGTGSVVRVAVFTQGEAAEKAKAAGADLVMLGSLLAGCRESPGEMVNYQGRAWKEYRGMGSLKAMRKGSGDRYGQNSSGKLVAEGVEGRVPYRGPLTDTVFQLLGGLRSGMGYVGAENLAALRERATFVRITPGGLKESHTHDITITEEPVNYQQSS